MAPADGRKRPSTGRKLATTAEHQYSLSNKTVSQFLGGRQLSWMSSALPVKPSPRPSPRHPKESLPELPQLRPSSGDLHQQRDQSSIPVAPAIPATALVASGRPQLTAQSPAPSALTQPTAGTSISAAPALPSPSRSERVSPSISPTTEPRPNGGVSERLSPTSATTAAHFELIDPVNAVPAESPHAQSIHDSRSDTTAANDPPNSTENEAGSADISPVASHAALSPTTSPKQTKPTCAPMTAFRPPPDGNQEPPPKRQRTGNMALQLLHQLNALQRLERQVQQSGGENELDGDVERPRYQLLQSACAAGDLFLIVLHQVFCCWSHNNSIGHDLCIRGGLDPNMIDNAFGSLGTILKSNSKIRPSHAQFFRDFPASLEVLRTRVPLYAATVTSVLKFLMNLSFAWQIVNNDHKKLGYPLLVDELLNIFELYSKHLQIIVFRSSRRALHVPDGQIGELMDELFRQDQSAHMDGNGSFIIRPGNNCHSDPNNQLLIQKYGILVAQANASSSVQGTNSVPVQQSLQQQPRHQRQHSGDLNSPLMMHRQNTGMMQGVQSPTGLQFTTAGPVSNNYAFTQIPASQNHQAPLTSMSPGTANMSLPTNQTFLNLSSPVQSPMLLSNANVNSPGSGSFMNAVSPIQSPVMTNGQYFPSPGYLGNQQIQQQQHSGQPSTPILHNYAQHLQPRRTSQQFQVPSPQPAQLQGLMGSTNQARDSPLQSNASSVQQARVPAYPPASFPSNTSVVSPRLPLTTTLSVPSVTPNLRRHFESTAPVFDVSNFQLPPLPLQHQQQQRQLQQQRLQQQQHQQRLQRQQQQPPQQQYARHPYRTNQIEQSNIRPRQSQATGSQQTYQDGTNSTGQSDFRRALPPYIPAAHYPHDSYDRKSLEMSLHQAHLRSPKRILKGNGFSSPPERYYQSVRYLALQPTPIPQQKFLHTFQFSLSDDDYHRISSDTIGIPPAVNLYSNGSLRVRLRVCLVKKVTETIPEEDWVLADNYWPEHIHMQLNQQPLMCRRKQQHAKDQPVEIGMLVRPGENILKVSVPVQKPFNGNAMPFVAVEVIETLSHDSVYALSNLGADAVIPADATRAIIRKRLGGPEHHSDDEIAMVTTDISINLADPFSYSLWTTPVRGQSCTHLECFDLQTWLETRPGKKSCFCGAKRTSDCLHCPKEPSLVDKWKCPLCQGDARPYSLRIDGFLVEVRRDLADRGLLAVKEIKVTADGSWSPVIPDDDDDLGSEDEPFPNGIAPKLSPLEAAKKKNRLSRVSTTEIICLDDD